MAFSPSQAAHFVELVAKIEGHVAASSLFKRLDPSVHVMDPGELKNWPAYRKLLELKNQETIEALCARDLEE